MNNKTLILIMGCVLLFVGLVKPDFSNIIPSRNNTPIIVVTEPMSDDLKQLCEPVINALQNGGSSRVHDGRRLSSLYMDLASLIELDGDNQVIKNTEEIRQANRLSGVMLRLNIKDKYPNLGSAANAVVVQSIGDDILILDNDLRTKAVDAFRALAWACNEGSK